MRRIHSPMHRLLSALALFALTLSSVGAPALAAPSAAPQPRPPAAVAASYGIGWVNVYKYVTAPLVCGGSGIVNEYFGGEECGFGIFTISPAAPDKDITVNFRDSDGNIFHTEAAAYDLVDDEYSVPITPESDWPIGPIQLEAVMDPPDTGSGSTGFFLNTLVLLGEQDQAEYEPGDPLVISGTVTRRTGTSLTPVDLPVDAEITARLIDPDTDAVMVTVTDTATAGGAWSVNFSGGSTSGFEPKVYEAVVDADWTDDAAANGPPDWHAQLNLAASFGAGSGDPVFSARSTATNGAVRANQTYLTVIGISNTTSLAATGVTVEAVMAPGAVFVSSVPAPAGGAGTSGSPFTWSFASIAAGAQARIYFYSRAKSFAEDSTIVWQLLDLDAEVSYSHDSQAKTDSETTLGPKVVPVGEVGDSVRHGQRPFPVALVDYVDIKHDAANTGSYFKDEIFPTLIDRYLEMSMGQLLAVPVLPGVGRGDVTYASTPSATYKWAPLQPNGFCSGVTSGSGTTPPAGATYRIQNEYYQLPGTQGFYGSDSTGSNYAGALTGVGPLVNVDNGCGAPGKIAYDAATLMDPDIDYNDFDSDRDGWVDFFELVYAGQPENILGQTGVNNVWPHSSSLEYYYPGGYVSHDQLRNHQDQPLYYTDASQSAMTTSVTAFKVYVKVGPYNVNAEFSDEVTFSHEYGHSMGLPDNYSLGARDTMNDWDLMSSGSGHMSIWDKQELGWIVPKLISSTVSVPSQKELKVDTNSISWFRPDGTAYTLGGNVHNAEVYKVNLPKVLLFDPAIIPSGDWVYYSAAGNDFGYPGHIFDISFDGNLTNGAADVHLQFRSWYEIEKDYDYGYVQVSTDGGATWTNLESEQGTTGDTNPNQNNHGNGITCVSGAQADPTCGVVDYPEPQFITDTFDLSTYAGDDFILRWAYSTDPGLAFRGWVIDDISLLADSDVVYFDDAEDPQLSNDDSHVYNGWLRSNGTATAEHAYWMGVRDQTGYDSSNSFQAGVVIEYANEAHGFGNVGVDNPPALTVIDSQPTPGSDTPNLDDAAWRPYPLDPGDTGANNRDLFTDCGTSSYADGPRHVDNYDDPSREDTLWLFAYQRLSMLVTSLAGEGSNLTAGVTYQVPAVCTPGGGGESMLSISKTDSPDPVKAGSNLTYTLTVLNTGDTAATQVVVTDNVPADTTFVSCGGGTSCAHNGGVVTWQVPDQPASGSVQLILVVAVSGSLNDTDTITNSSYMVDSAETEPVSGAPVTTNVTTVDLPQLSIGKTAAPALAIENGLITYTLTVHNSGQVAATAVNVTDQVPAGTSYVSCSGGTSCAQAAGTVSWVVGSLGAGATIQLQMVVRVNDGTQPGARIVNSTYSVDSAETNPVAGSPVTKVVFMLIRMPLLYR